METDVSKLGQASLGAEAGPSTQLYTCLLSTVGAKSLLMKKMEGESLPETSPSTCSGLIAPTENE